MTIHRRAFLKSTGALGVGAGLNLAMPGIGRAALTPVKFTLAWLPLGTFSYAYVAKAKGFFEKHGLDVTIDRGFGSGKVCVPVDQGQYEFGVLKRVSLCSPSLSVCKHWKRVRVGSATRAALPGHRRFHRFRHEIDGPYLMRRARNDLHGRKDAGLNQAPYRVACDA